MQFVVDIHQRQDGGVAGVIKADSGHVETFSGWMELLHILEPPSADEANRRGRNGDAHKTYDVVAAAGGRRGDGHPRPSA